MRTWLLLGLLLTVCGGAQGQLKLAPQPLLEHQCAVLRDDAKTIAAVQPLLLALKDPNAHKRAQAAQQLAASCARPAVDALVDQLKDSEPAVRVAVIDALAALGDKDTYDFVNELLFDQDVQVKLALIRYYSAFKIFKTRNAVVNGIANPSEFVVKEDDDIRVRCIAILTAAQFPDPQHTRKSVSFLYAFQNSPHKNVRDVATETMYALKDTRNGLLELMSILKNGTHAPLRIWAAQWLGKLGAESARDALQTVTQEEPSEFIKQAARDALALLDQAKKNGQQAVRK